MAAAISLLLLAACGGSSDEPVERPESSLKTSIEGSCRPIETGSEISLTYSVELSGNGRISRVRFLVDGIVTEQSGQTGGRTLSRTASVRVPDRTTHTFEVAAEAGSMRSSATTTVTCDTPTPGPRL